SERRRDEDRLSEGQTGSLRIAGADVFEPRRWRGAAGRGVRLYREGEVAQPRRSDRVPLARAARLAQDAARDGGAGKRPARGTELVWPHHPVGGGEGGESARAAVAEAAQSGSGLRTKAGKGAGRFAGGGSGILQPADGRKRQPGGDSGIAGRRCRASGVLSR